MKMSLIPCSRSNSSRMWIKRVVAQIELIVAAVGRIDVDGHEDVRRHFSRRHAGLFQHVGQHGQGQVHPVLHQHLRQVQIHALLERDGQIVRAVVGALGGHVQHVLHAVDLLLDGGRHGLGHDLALAPG